LFYVWIFKNSLIKIVTETIRMKIRVELKKLTGLNRWNLSIMRNEIYARYGYYFTNPKIRDYFDKQTWYNQIPLSDANDHFIYTHYLSEIEKFNINLIKRFE